MSNATDRPALPALEQEPVALVRLGGRAESGELPHRPQAAPVHRGVDPARERVLARRAQPCRRGPSRRGPRAVTGLGTGSPDSVRSNARVAASGGSGRVAARSLGRSLRSSWPSAAATPRRRRSPARIAAARYGIDTAGRRGRRRARVGAEGRRPPSSRNRSAARPPPRGGAATRRLAASAPDPPGDRDALRSPSHSSLDALALGCRGVVRTGGSQSRAAPEVQHLAEFADRPPRAPSRSALLTTKTSAISRMPGLRHLHGVAQRPARATTTAVSVAAATSTSAWPTPTVSTTTSSYPAASRMRTASGAASAMPPRCPRVAIDRMKTPGSVACSCIRTRSPSSAPPVYGEVGSTARTATATSRARAARTSPAASVDFPTPGAPVRPIVEAAPGAGIDAGGQRLQVRRAVLDQSRSRAADRAALAAPAPPRSPTATSTGRSLAVAGTRVGHASAASARRRARDRAERVAQRTAVLPLPRSAPDRRPRATCDAHHGEVDLLALEPTQQRGRAGPRARPHLPHGRARRRVGASRVASSAAEMPGPPTSAARAAVQPAPFAPPGEDRPRAPRTRAAAALSPPSRPGS